MVQEETTTTTRRPMAAIFLVLAILVGAGTALALNGFLATYGPTTGSRVDGAMQALVYGAAPLLIVIVLATVAFAVARRSAVIRTLAVAAVILSVGGVLLGGAQAAVAKYDELAKVPNCGAGEVSGAFGAGSFQQAFADLRHPGPFGGGWSGVDGCGAEVLNVDFAAAAAHYRTELAADGWTVARDDSSELMARRGDLVFALKACGPTVEIRPATSAGNGNAC